MQNIFFSDFIFIYFEFFIQNNFSQISFYSNFSIFGRWSDLTLFPFSLPFSSHSMRQHWELWLEFWFTWLWFWLFNLIRSGWRDIVNIPSWFWLATCFSLPPRCVQQRVLINCSRFIVWSLNYWAEKHSFHKTKIMWVRFFLFFYPIAKS